MIPKQFQKLRKPNVFMCNIYTFARSSHEKHVKPRFTSIFYYNSNAIKIITRQAIMRKVLYELYSEKIQF